MNTTSVQTVFLKECIFPLLDFFFKELGYAWGFFKDCFSKMIFILEYLEPLMKIILEHLQKVKCKYSHTLKKFHQHLVFYVSVQLLSRVRLCDPMDCSTPGFSVHHQLPELAQTHVHRVGEAIQPFNLSSASLPAFNHAQHQGLAQCLSSSHWSYSFSISPSSEYSGLISFTIDWFDLLAVQGPLKSLLQHHNSKE